MEDSQIQMVNLLMDEMDGNAEEFYEYEERIKGVNLDDVKNLAKICDEFIPQGLVGAVTQVTLIVID